MASIKKWFLRSIFSSMLFLLSLILLTTLTPIPFIWSTLISFGVYAIGERMIKIIQLNRYLKSIRLTRSEYKHIQSQLAQAKVKIKQLQRAAFRTKSIRSIKDLIEMIRIAKRIVQLIKEKPNRFFQAESFFYSHLDSTLDLATKYALLTGQPVRDQQIQLSLYDTKELLTSMNDVFQQDLHQVIAADVEMLQYEMDYARISIDQSNQKKVIRGELPYDKSTYKS